MFLSSFSATSLLFCLSSDYFAHSLCQKYIHTYLRTLPIWYYSKRKPLTCSDRIWLFSNYLSSFSPWSHWRWPPISHHRIWSSETHLSPTMMRLVHCLSSHARLCVSSFQRNTMSAYFDQHPMVDQFFPKPIVVADDDENLSNSNNNADEEDEHQAHWPHFLNKRYATKVIRGDGRVWAIPYRFGKRAAMPYRFGKRAGMHFRLGKKNALLWASSTREIFM